MAKNKAGKEKEKIPEVDIGVLLDCIRTDPEKSADICGYLRVDEAAMVLWNLCLLKGEAKKLEIIGLQGVQALLYALAHSQNNVDTRLACMGLLSCLAEVQETRRPIMKELPMVAHILKQTDRERLISATSIVLKWLAQDDLFIAMQRGEDLIVNLLLEKLSSPMLYTTDTHQNLTFVLNSLASDEDLAYQIYQSGGVPILLRCLTSSDAVSCSNAASCLNKILHCEQAEEASPPIYIQLLEMRVVPLLIGILEPGRVEEVGAAAATTLLNTMVTAPESEALLARVIEDNGVEKLLKLLPEPLVPEVDKEVGDKKKKAKKKKPKKPPPLTESGTLLQRAVASLLSKCSMNVDCFDQIFNTHGILRLLAMTESGNEETRMCAREALWNLGYFNAPGEIVDHFQLGRDELSLTLKPRLTNMNELRTQQVCRTLIISLIHSCAAIGCMSVTRGEGV